MPLSIISATVVEVVAIPHPYCSIVIMIYIKSRVDSNGHDNRWHDTCYASRSIMPVFAIVVTITCIVYGIHCKNEDHDHARKETSICELEPVCQSKQESFVGVSAKICR